jgi:perosamine synthetase
MDLRKEQLGVGTLELSQREKDYVIQALDSNRLSYGPLSKKFESMFAALHDVKFAVFVNSGTSALSIALATLKELHGWKDGDEVIVPSLTFVATVNVVLEHNLVPVFVDCDSQTYNMDASLIEEKITDRTCCIMPVHLYGLIADMGPIMDIANRHDLRVVEDSCETIGVNYNGQKTGSFGDISCFSTYVAHFIVTGVGGLALTNDPKKAEILRSLANHGRDSIYLNIDDDKDIDGSAFQEVVRRRFRFVRRGYSFRATEMEAGLGIGQLETFPDILSARQGNAANLTQKLEKYSDVLQLPRFDSFLQEHGFMMFPIVVKKDARFRKQSLIEHLEKMNIETRDMMPLINQPVYEYMNINENDYPVAQWVNACGFYIGCHQNLEESDLQYIEDVIAEFLSLQSA